MDASSFGTAASPYGSGTDLETALTLTESAYTSTTSLDSKEPLPDNHLLFQRYHKERAILFYKLLEIAIPSKLLPPTEYRRVLHLGAESELWAAKVAEKNKNTQVIAVGPEWTAGSDLPNYELQVDGLIGDWTFRENSVDRVLLDSATCSKLQPAETIEKIYKTLTPGGDILICYADIRLCRDKELSDCLLEKITKDVYNHLPDWSQSLKYLQNSGFCDIKCETVKLPVGPWCDEKEHIGTINLNHMEILLQGMLRENLRCDNAKSYLEVDGMRDSSVHRGCYNNLYVFSASRPRLISRADMNSSSESQMTDWKHHEDQYCSSGSSFKHGRKRHCCFGWV